MYISLQIHLHNYRIGHAFRYFNRRLALALYLGEEGTSDQHAIVPKQLVHLDVYNSQDENTLDYL